MVQKMSFLYKAFGFFDSLTVAFTHQHKMSSQIFGKIKNQTQTLSEILAETTTSL